MACWAQSSMPGGQVGVGEWGGRCCGSARWCGLRGGPQAPAPRSALTRSPAAGLHGGRALAAPRLQLALAGEVAVTSPGLGDGTFASVYQDLGFDVRRSTGIPME